MQTISYIPISGVRGVQKGDNTNVCFWPDTDTIHPRSRHAQSDTLLRVRGHLSERDRYNDAEERKHGRADRRRHNEQRHQQHERPQHGLKGDAMHDGAGVRKARLFDLPCHHAVEHRRERGNGEERQPRGDQRQTDENEINRREHGLQSVLDQRKPAALAEVFHSPRPLPLRFRRDEMVVGGIEGTAFDDRSVVPAGRLVFDPGGGLRAHVAPQPLVFGGHDPLHPLAWDEKQNYKQLREAQAHRQWQWSPNRTRRHGRAPG